MTPRIGYTIMYNDRPTEMYTSAEASKYSKLEDYARVIATREIHLLRLSPSPCPVSYLSVILVGIDEIYITSVKSISELNTAVSKIEKSSSFLKEIINYIILKSDTIDINGHPIFTYADLEPDMVIEIDKIERQMANEYSDAVFNIFHKVRGDY